MAVTVMLSASAAAAVRPASLRRLRAPVAAPPAQHRSLGSLPVSPLPARGGFRAALGGVVLRAAAPLRRLCDAFRTLTVECNRKKGKGNTLEGTRRKRARVSGFRTRIASVGGAKVLAARRKKGRKVLVPASAVNHWNRMKK